MTPRRRAERVPHPLAAMAHSSAMRRVAGAVFALALAAVGVVGVAASPAAAAVLPSGFTEGLVASVPSPTSMAFTPDGRLLVTSQPGTLRVVKAGALLATPALDITAKTCSNSERGLLGVAVDPSFTTNAYVFVYYSFKKNTNCDSGTVNRVARFVMTGDTLSSETVLIDNIPSPAGNHNAGYVHFGKDNQLYVSVGDGGCDYAGDSGCAQDNDATRDMNALVGKILRIDRDGGIPAGNPFTGAGTGRCNTVGVTTPGTICQEILAFGLRNPFRMAFDPNAASTRFYINDVGQSTWEEIDLGASGADFGWNVREGHCATGSTTNCGPPPGGMTNPIFDYGRSDGCGTITGGAFVPNGVWPAAYQGKYVFADYLCGKIFRLDPNGAGGFTRVDFVTALGNNSATDLLFGPYGRTQALYYTTYAGGGQVRRIVNTDTIPALTVQGFTWYSDGSSSKSGPSGTVVTAFGTSMRTNTAYRLMTSPAQSIPDLTCTVDLVPVNINQRLSNGRGFVANTAGPVARVPGDYDLCFVSGDGGAVSLPVTFRVT